MDKIGICSRICELKNNLKNSDYKVLKYIENQYPIEEYEELRQQRKAWRDEINELEKELNGG